MFQTAYLSKQLLRYKSWAVVPSNTHCNLVNAMVNVMVNTGAAGPSFASRPRMKTHWRGPDGRGGVCMVVEGGGGRLTNMGPMQILKTDHNAARKQGTMYRYVTRGP